MCTETHTHTCRSAHRPGCLHPPGLPRRNADGTIWALRGWQRSLGWDLSLPAVVSGSQQYLGSETTLGALLDRTLPWIPSRKRLNRAHRPHPKWALGLITIRQKEKGSLLGALEAKLLGC